MDDISWLGGEDIPHAHVISYIPDSLSSPQSKIGQGFSTTHPAQMVRFGGLPFFIAWPGSQQQRRASPLPDGEGEGLQEGIYSTGPFAWQTRPHV
jgi:hypothetical protein